MDSSKLNSSFLAYLVEHNLKPGDALPTLAEISDLLGISVGKLREQVEHARQLGIISVKPRVGVQRRQFNFNQAVMPAVLFGLATEEASFAQLAQMRTALEISLWDEAVGALDEADIAHLRQLIANARAKLNAAKIQIPYSEHRAFHMAMFAKLDNPFVCGLLETYWDAYQATEVTRYMSYDYWATVWDYHAKIVDDIEAGQVAESRKTLIDHFNLLKTTPESVNNKTV